MFYTWKLSFVLLLRQFLMNISTTNIDKVVSMRFSQRRSEADEYTLNQLSFSTQYQRWNNIGSSTLNRRNSFNIVSTLFCERWKKVDKHQLVHRVSSSFIFAKFQRWNNVGSSTLHRHNSIDVASTLFCQYWNKVEKCTLAHLLFWTK